jgi:hypothetical protein
MYKALTAVALLLATFALIPNNRSTATSAASISLPLIVAQGKLVDQSTHTDNNNFYADTIGVV